MGLDFSPKVADFAMQGFYSPSLSYTLQGYPPWCIDCIALPLSVPFDLIQVLEGFFFI